MDIIACTPRLFIRRLNENDAPRLRQICRSPHILRWMPDWDISPEQALHYVKWRMTEYAKATPERMFISLAVCEQTSGLFIGIIAFQCKKLLNDEIEIMYFLDVPFTGRGYMAEAAQALCPWLFGEYDLKYISAIVEPDNFPSQRTVEKCGFVKQGEMSLLNDGETSEKPFFYYRLPRPSEA